MPLLFVRDLFDIVLGTGNETMEGRFGERLSLKWGQGRAHCFDMGLI